MLKINDDLKDYLKEAINRGESEHYKRYCKLLDKDPFAWQWLFKFENGYGASVIKRDGSFGFEEDLFELGVIRWGSENEWHLSYSTELTDDVIGHLSNDEVMLILYKIKNLKERQKDEN